MRRTVLSYSIELLDNWQWESHPFKKLEFGKWELVIPPQSNGSPAIVHGSEVKVIIRKQDGQLIDRLSPWAKYVVQPPKEANQGTNYKQIVWNPPTQEVIKPPPPPSNAYWDCVQAIETVLNQNIILDYRNILSSIQNLLAPNR